MSNIIKIKRSTSVATPASLSQGELAYSESDGGSTGSGNLFIGTANGVVKIGGNTDSATLAGLKIFESITGDSGTATADTQSDTIAITGGTGISTVASDGPEGLVITNDSPNVDQNLWETIAGDTGSTAANITTDTLTIAGGTGVSTAMSGDTLTITNDSPNVNQNLFQTHTVTDTDSGYTWAETGSVVAGSITDTLTWVSGTGIDIDVDATSGAIKIINTSPGGTQDIWYTFTGDTGTQNASTTTTSFDFAGGTGITTAVSGDVLTITNDSPNVDQNLYATFIGDSGTTTASATADTIDIAGGTSITTTVTADTVTIDGTPLIDSDTMAGALATNVASAESIVAYVGTEIATALTSDMTYKGAFDPTAGAGAGSPDLDTITSAVGDTYTVTVAGTYNWTTGSAELEVGDVLIAEAAGVLNNVASWTIIQKNLPEFFVFQTITSDAGSAVADQLDDTLSILGGTGISTSVTGDVLTITNDSPNADQNIWLNMDADSGGPVAANTTSDTFTITGGTSITTAISGDAVTITNDAPHIATNLSVGTVTATNVPINSSTGTDIATLPAATATLAGIVTNAAQTFGGAKSFFSLTGTQALDASPISGFTIDCGTFT